MFKDEILENKRRQRIYDVLVKQPGLYTREMQRLLGIPLTSLQHHLNYMVQKNIIIEEKDPHFSRYYCNPLDPREKKLLVILRQKRQREIVLMLLIDKKAKYHSIVEALNLPNSTVSFYLKQLLDNDVVERTKIGYENVYTLKDADQTEKVLIAYQKSLLDTIVDKWTSTWLENQVKKKNQEGENQ